MAAPTLDFRPAGFFFRWGAAGAATVALRAPVGTLEGRELRMWVQPKALLLPDIDLATATATISDVTTEEVDGDEFDVAVATFADVGLLTQSTWYRVLLADGDQVWASGRVRTSNDGTDEQSTTLAVTVGSGSIELQITVATAGPGGGTGLPAGTAGQMFRVGEDGETVEGVSPNAPGAWLRLNETGHVPDVHLSSDIVRESEMTSAISSAIDDLVGGAPGALDTLNELAAALNDDAEFAATVAASIAARQRVGTAPVVVANGGMIPAGTVLALLLGATATLPAASSHGLGQEMTLTCIGGVDCVLSATGSDLLGSGAGLTIDKDYTTKIAAADISAFAFPGALNWAVTGTAFESADAQALLSGYAPISVTDDIADVAADVNDLAATAAAADTSELRARTLGDALRGMSAELGASVTRAFRGDGTGNGRWWSPSFTDELTDGVAYRCLRRPERPPTAPWFSEYIAQPHDGGAGSWDNLEGADVEPDESFGVSIGDPTVDWAAGQPRDFHEQTPQGGTTDGSFWWPALGNEWGEWVETLTDITFGTGVGRKWIRVPYDLGDGGTYWTDPDDGALFLLRHAATLDKFESISQDGDDVGAGPWVAETWWVANNYFGDIARVIVKNGLEGDVVANPDAGLVTPGATSFVDVAGKFWTGEAAARVVSLGTGSGAYTPAVSVDWDPVPSTIAEALDQVAARLTVLEP